MPAMLGGGVADESDRSLPSILTWAERDGEIVMDDLVWSINSGR